MKCYMLLLLLVAGSALPNTNSLPVGQNLSHPQSQPPQTPSPRPVAPSYNQSHNQSHKDLPTLNPSLVREEGDDTYSV